MEQETLSPPVSPIPYPLFPIPYSLLPTPYSAVANSPPLRLRLRVRRLNN